MSDTFDDLHEKLVACFNREEGIDFNGDLLDEIRAVKMLVRAGIEVNLYHTSGSAESFVLC